MRRARVTCGINGMCSFDFLPNAFSMRSLSSMSRFVAAHVTQMSRGSSRFGPYSRYLHFKGNENGRSKTSRIRFIAPATSFSIHGGVSVRCKSRFGMIRIGMGGSPSWSSASVSRASPSMRIAMKTRRAGPADFPHLRRCTFGFFVFVSFPSWYFIRVFLYLLNVEHEVGAPHVLRITLYRGLVVRDCLDVFPERADAISHERGANMPVFCLDVFPERADAISHERGANMPVGQHLECCRIVLFLMGMSERQRFVQEIHD